MRIGVNDETVIHIEPLDKSGLQTIRWEGDTTAVLDGPTRRRLVEVLAVSMTLDEERL